MAAQKYFQDLTAQPKHGLPPLGGSVRVEPSDDYRRRRVDSFDLELPWGWILLCLFALALILDFVARRA